MTLSATADIGTPEHVMDMARQGRLTKQALAEFLAVDKRAAYFDSCSAIEKRLTEACTATGDPCIEGGCAVEGEVCLQPVLNAGAEYMKACGEAFLAFYADPRNRR